MAQATVAELLAQAMELAADDRLALATEIIESVEGAEDPEWAAAWAAELDRRVRAMDAGVTKGIPWDDARADILERLRSR